MIDTHEYLLREMAQLVCPKLVVFVLVGEQYNIGSLQFYDILQLLYYEPTVDIVFVNSSALRRGLEPLTFELRMSTKFSKQT